MQFERCGVFGLAPPSRGLLASGRSRIQKAAPHALGDASNSEAVEPAERQRPGTALMGLVEHTPIHEYQAVLPADQHLAGLDEVGRLEALKKIRLTIEQVMTSQKQTREAARKLARFENATFVHSPDEVDLDYL